MRTNNHLQFFFKHLHTQCLVCSAIGAHNPANLCCECIAQLPTLGNLCIRCANPVTEDQDTCGACIQKPPLLDRIFTQIPYQYPYNRLITQLKLKADFSGLPWLQCTLDQLLETREKSNPEPIDALIPVANHWLRKGLRGYNQSEILANRLSAKSGIPVVTDLLKKIKYRPPQRMLNRQKRLSNLRGSWSIERQVNGLNLAIVDDVMSTGSTLESVAQTLKKAGAKRVEAWVLARNI